MAINFRLGDIWANALDRADLTGTSYPDLNRKADLVNRALAKVHYMTTASNQNYIAQSVQINVVPNVQYYPLPTDFYQLLKIYIIESGMYRVVRRLSFEMIHGMQPNSDTPATLEVNYVPVAPKFHNPPDDGEVITTSFPDGLFEELVAIEVARKLLMRGEKTNPDLEAERKELMAMLQNYLEPRDAAEPLEMVDTHQRWRRPWPFALVHPAIADIRYLLYGNQLRIFQTDSREI